MPVQVTPEMVAEWERRVCTVLREQADLVTRIDDELPELEDWLARYPR